MMLIAEELLHSVKLLQPNGTTPAHPIILCFVTSDMLPSSAVPMPLDPNPPLGSHFDNTFQATLAEATATNPAVHDGAIMLLRTSPASPYKVAGWSYRLASALAPTDGMKNRGSAYNSCLAMSRERDVDLIALISNHGLEFFGAK